MSNTPSNPSCGQMLFAIIGVGITIFLIGTCGSRPDNTPDGEITGPAVPNAPAAGPTESDPRLLVPGSPAGSPNKIACYTAAQDFVTRSLKCPGSAQFPRSADDYDVRYNGDNLYMVSSWVDAQNDFGALKRSVFNLTMHYDGGDNWSLVSDVYLSESSP